MVWKFRGYDAVGSKGWVYGDLVHNKRVDLTDRVMVGGYEVVPESVGQFTGKYDIHHKEVYEHDVTKITIHGKDTVLAVVTYDAEMCAFLHEVLGEGSFCMSGECEVIGRV